MILGKFHPFENRRFIGRTTDHVPHFRTAFFRQIRIRLSQSWHDLIARLIIGGFQPVVNL